MYTGSQRKRGLIGSAVGTVGDVAQVPLGVASEAVSDAFGLGSGVVKGVGEGVGGAVSGVGDAIEGVGGPVGKVVAIPVKVAGDVVSGVGKAAGGIVDGVGKVVGSIVKIPSKIIGSVTGSGSTDSDISGLKQKLGVGSSGESSSLGIQGVSDNPPVDKETGTPQYFNASNVPGWDKLDPAEQEDYNIQMDDKMKAKARMNADIMTGSILADPTDLEPSPSVQAVVDSREETAHQKAVADSLNFNRRFDEEDVATNGPKRKRFVGVGPAIKSFLEGPQD